MPERSTRLTDEEIEHLRQEYRWRAGDNAWDVQVTHSLRRFGEFIVTIDALTVERDKFEREFRLEREKSEQYKGWINERTRLLGKAEQERDKLAAENAVFRKACEGLAQLRRIAEVEVLTVHVTDGAGKTVPSPTRITIRPTEQDWHIICNRLDAALAATLAVETQ